MDRDKWLAERRSGIGGSDAAAALGLSRYRSPYQLWLEKRGQLAETPDNWSMRWGRALEADLRQHYSDITGRSVFLASGTGIVRHPTIPWMLCTPDGGTDDKRLLEIKTSRSNEGWGEPGTDQVPEHYLLQVQHSLIVTGFVVADVVLGVYGVEPAIYHVEADPELHEAIIDGEREFWRYVESGEPPQIQTYADVVARYGRRSVANAIMADQQINSTLQQLLGLRATMKELESLEETAKADVMKYLADNDTLVDGNGNVLCTWKQAKAGEKFDIKTFRARHPDLYVQFLTAGEPNRRFLLKDMKP
jgi:putative phage-type endonuclease